MAKQHFTHPNHLLFEYSNDQVYICKACNTLGSERRYRCHDCDFDLHEFCADCHTNLSSPQLHQHELQLSTSKDLQTMISCAVCQNSIKGLIFYHCSSQQCNFNVHTLCTQLKLSQSQSQSGSSSSTVPPPPTSSSSQGGIPPPVHTSRRKRFLKKTVGVISTVTLGVASSIVYDMLGIEEELRGEDKS